MRKIISIEFGRRMNTNNALASMHQGASMGLTKWVNKDIRKAASTGDWSELETKAKKQLTRFRNEFYA
jgi:hypothetical protein